MSSQSERLEELRFFGQITASVTHELKNYLALINEYNGLLGDLIMAHEMGQELDLERLKSLSGDIKRQVAAGSRVLDNLNGFAHSVDSEAHQVELAGLLKLFVDLSRRTAQRKGVDLDLTPEGPAASAQTQPFVLLRGLWMCLQGALAGAQAGQRLCLEARPAGQGAELSLSGEPLAGFDAQAAGSWEALLELLHASLERGPQGEVRLCLKGQGA